MPSADPETGGTPAAKPRGVTSDLLGLEPLVAAGAVTLVLENWTPVSEGYQIYYSGRRQLPTGLRLLIETIREVQPGGPAF